MMAILPSVEDLWRVREISYVTKPMEIEQSSLWCLHVLEQSTYYSSIVA